MEKIIMTKNEIEEIGKKRGHKLPHAVVNRAIEGDYAALLTTAELEIMASPKENGYRAMEWLKMPIEEREVILNNKAVELLRK